MEGLVATPQKLVSPKTLAKKNTLHFPNESKEYRQARDNLLAKEIELRRNMENVAAARRELPPGGRVQEDYVFDGLGPDGQTAKVKLSELFAQGKDTLIAYNFMFPRYSKDDRPGPAQGETAKLKREEAPCPSCVAFIDALDAAVEHLEAAGFNFAVIAKAPLERLTTFAKERGWRHVRLLSSAGNNFKHDYQAEMSDGEQMPMMNVFHKRGGGIEHFWSSEMFYLDPDPGQDPRHNGTIEPLWNLMDLTPEGRPSDWHEQLAYDERRKS
jgi:predicted dithiol-disulfide oxidoreductase (DUF899 family)